ncbi:MAG: germination protein YpeB [Clostridia bacterium]|nr:germination protein YpeB [Clostridia bacterium]
MKKGKTIAIIVLLAVIGAMAGVIAWLAIWKNEEAESARQARLQIDNTYNNALYDSIDAVREMENDLAKLLVSADEAQSIAIAADAYKNASSAAEVAGRLPIDGYEPTGLMKFLNQVGEFSASYIRAAAVGADLTALDEQVENVYVATVNVRQQLSEALEKTGEEGYSTIKRIEAGNFITIGVGEMPIEFPTIIYDGPFSDADHKETWKGLDGLEQITQEQAVAIAREKLGIEGVVVGKSNSSASMYEIEGTMDGQEAYASITEMGGIIASAFVVSDANGVSSEEETMKFALECVINLGYCDCLAPVWYVENEGVAVVNLAPKVNDVIYYPDLVKVKVGGGKFLGIEACGYCANHCDREFAPSRITPETAKTCVSKKLNVINTRLVVIPKDQEERLCYEVTANYKGLDYFVYIDAYDGKQVNLLRVIDDEQGKMVL